MQESWGEELERGGRSGGVRDSKREKDGVQEREMAKETLMNADNKEPNLSSEPPRDREVSHWVNKSTGPCLRWFALQAPT